MSEKKAWNLEQIFFESIDKIKYLVSPELWANELLNCSKNELFVLLLLYRNDDVNMSQIAQYIGVPLNTATGIVARMEKKNLITRTRSVTDKRVVTIEVTEEGRDQIKKILAQLFHYGNLIFENFTAEEVQMVVRLFDKVINVLSKEQDKESEKDHQSKKIHKIVIE